MLQKLCTLLIFTIPLFLSSDTENDEIGTVIGIDLGTTYSCVGVYKDGRVEIIANDQGNRITPSYVAFTSDNKRLLGDAAKNQLSENPKNTIFDVKRIIGRLFSEKSVQSDLKHFPFEVISDNDDKPRIKLENGETFSPEEISAMVLTKMKEIAESYLSEEVKNAVVTVPAYFNDAQRAATKISGTIAGLNILRIINEPTAAAIAYGLDSVENDENIIPEEKIVLVFDLGGGTFDVSLLSIENGVFEVMATSGDTHLGGEDFDQRVMQYLMKIYKKKTGKDVRKEKRTVQKLRKEVEKAKRALSSVHQVKIEIENFYQGQDFSHVLTRAKFEEINMDLFKKTLTPMKKVLNDAKIDKTDVDEIVLVGGSTRIPRIQKLVQEFFDHKEISKGLNPDEAIAYGAAVQGAVLSGKSNQPNIVLIDVCPLSMGIETKGGVMNVIVERNSAIPVKKTKQFTTVMDQQEMVTFKVYEGERSMAKDNHLLGQFDLTGIQPEPRGVPQLMVTFELDTNGLLKVSAEDEASSSREEITIKNDANRLSDQEIQEMLENAKKYAEEDKKAKELAETWNQLEGGAYSIKTRLEDENSDLSQKMSEEQKKSAMEAAKEAIDWIELNKEDESVEIDEVKQALEKFEKVTKPILESCGAGGSKLSDDGESEDDEEDFDPFGEDDWGKDDDDDFENDIIIEDDDHWEL